MEFPVPVEMEARQILLQIMLVLTEELQQVEVAAVAVTAATVEMEFVL